MKRRQASFVAGLDASIRTRGLLVGHDHVLVAVSGGADSIALLLAMNALKRSRGFDITVAHLNHQLRGVAAREDAAFVEALAQRLKVPCVVGRSDVRRLARRKHISLEMAAREARYRFLARTAHAQEASVIATAHTADDQAETVLLRLARGSGPGGLGGMRWRGRLSRLFPGLPDSEMELIRPLLNVSRTEIETFLHQQGQAWRDDATNASRDFLRSRVRHELLPLLETRLNPLVRSALWRTADILGEEDVWLDELAVSALRVCMDAHARLDRSRLTGMPLPLRRRVIRKWFVTLRVPAEKVDFGMVERVMTVAEASCGSRAVDMPGPWRVVRRYGYLALEEAPPLHAPFRVALTVPGETLLPEQGLRVVVERTSGITRESGAVPGALPAGASLSGKAVGRRRLYLRSPRPGDRMQPYGMRGSKKLQDILVDAKVPVDQRAALPVLECGGTIAWIPGYRIAHPYRVVNEAGSALQINIEHL